MVRTNRSILLLLIVVCVAPAALAQTPPTVPQTPPAAPPEHVASFGGMKPGDTVAEGWKVSAITFVNREVSVSVGDAANQLFTVVFSSESGPKGAFDTGDVRVYYRKTDLPQQKIGELGKAIADRAAAYASAHGGLKKYLNAVVEQEIRNNPEHNVTRETAQKFLGRLEGKWDVTVLQFEGSSAVPKTEGTGVAQRSRFLNDLIVREDGEGAPGKEFMAVGCSVEAAQCWLFMINNSWAGFLGGWGIFSESENSLKLLDPATKEPKVSLRIIDDNRNIVEFYGKGPHAKVVRTLRYDRAK